MYPHSHHQDDQPILDVRKISARYNGRFALEDVTFHLHAGERVAVVGPNGAGKSTLFKVVCCSHPAARSIYLAPRRADMCASPIYPNAARWTGTFPSVWRMWS